MRRIFGRGRYATVTSTLALIVALGGSAYAANTVRSIDIVDNAVQSADVRNGGLATIDHAPNSLGRSPRLWGQISNAGSLIRGVGIVTASGAGPGQYSVTFNRNVSNCAVSVTPFATTPVMAGYQVGTSVVTVTEFDETGAAANVPFDIIVVC